MLLFVTILQLIVALALILIVLFQSGKSQGLSGSIEKQGRGENSVRHHRRYC